MVTMPAGWSMWPRRSRAGGEAVKRTKPYTPHATLGDYKSAVESLEVALATSERQCAELAEENRDMLQDLRWIWTRVMGDKPGPPPMSVAVQMIADRCAELAAALKRMWTLHCVCTEPRAWGDFGQCAACLCAKPSAAILLAYRAQVERETRQDTLERIYGCRLRCYPPGLGEILSPDAESWAAAIAAEFAPKDAPKGETDAKRDRETTGD